MLSEKFNRQIHSGGLLVFGLFMLFYRPTGERMDQALGLIFVAGGLGLWIWTTYYWTATVAKSPRQCVWQLVGSGLSFALLALTFVVADSRSALPLFAMPAIVIATFLVSLAERDWRL